LASVKRIVADVPPSYRHKENAMLGFWLLTIFLLMFIVSLPTYPYSREWGYYPSGAALTILFVVWLLVWLDYLAFAWPWTTAVRY
jgi:hypothetical protein